jgi:hypothetical protein
MFKDVWLCRYNPAFWCYEKRIVRSRTCATILMFVGTSLEYRYKNKFNFHIFIIRVKRKVCSKELVKELSVGTVGLRRSHRSHLFIQHLHVVCGATCSSWTNLYSHFAVIPAFLCPQHIPRLWPVMGLWTHISWAPHFCVTSEPKL